MMGQLKFLFRADDTNVGDWWCPPFRYFPFKPAAIGDILDPSFAVEKSDTVIIGGGGIGSDFFLPNLDRIKASNPQTSIFWGAGVDTYSDSTKLLDPSAPDLYGNYFNFANEVGVRVFSTPQKFQYVPCASCMNNTFFSYRDVKPTNSIGFYNHKRATLMTTDNSNGFPVADNGGNSLEDKLRFLASCEYIVTNTYHGVYWATLLERKVICIPFKSGLLSFKYPPTYCWDGNLTDELLNEAHIFRNVLEESRRLNLEFYTYLTGKYDLV